MTTKKHFCTKYFIYEQKSTYNVDLRFYGKYNNGAVRADSGRRKNKQEKKYEYQLCEIGFICLSQYR